MLAYSILLTINMLSILILFNNVLRVRVSVMVLNATFINIRDISGRLVLLMKETGIPKKTTHLPQSNDKR
jgi:hypothetical protein